MNGPLPLDSAGPFLGVGCIGKGGGEAGLRERISEDIRLVLIAHHVLRFHFLFFMLNDLNYCEHSSPSPIFQRFNHSLCFVLDAFKCPEVCSSGTRGTSHRESKLTTVHPKRRPGGLSAERWEAGLTWPPSDILL